MEQGKRKMTRSLRTEDSAPSTSHRTKVRKVDPPEVNNRQDLGRILNNDALRDGDLTQKLVAMWIGSGADPDNGLLSKVMQENRPLQDCQEQCAEHENYIQKLWQKLEKTKNHINILRKCVRDEERSKSNLIQKITAITKTVGTITGHINYIIDTLRRCQRYKDHLSNVYHSVILPQRDQASEFKKHEEMLRTRMSNLWNERSSLIKHSTDSQIWYENKLREKEAELASIRAKQECTQKELEAITKEKEDLTIKLSKNENDRFDLKSECLKYEFEAKDITNKLAEVSANLESLKNEKLNTNDDLIAENLAFDKMNIDLESARVKHEDQLAVISLIRSANAELTKQLEHKGNERENLIKSLNILDTINADLDDQVEKLKESTSEEIEEMKKKLESAESAKSQMLKKNEEVREELAKKQDNEVKAHIEKYNSRFAKLKALEARYERKVSRIQQSSATAIANTNAEKSQLEEQLDSLKREKEECVQNLNRAENLLMKHVISEMQLRRKLERYENDPATLSSPEKKPREKGNLEKTGKSIARSVRTTSACSTSNVRKSILKPSTARKPGSPPLSLALPRPKKITFEKVFALSQESPIKFTDAASIMAFIKSDDTFDEMVATQKSFSQPLQYSRGVPQNTNSQVQTQPSGKKFFKSRANPFK